MPVIQYPDGEYAIDSTPIIHNLERRCAPARTIYPNDAVLNYLSLLIEDFADEWLTKCLFHYRFTYSADRRYGPQWVMDDTYPHASRDELDNLTEEFLARQTERMPLVGCIPEHRELLEQTYHEVLEILEPHVSLETFLFGTRPTLADFGLFGQLKTLATDPTPREIMREKAARTDMWVMRMDDLSGVDGEFSSFDDIAPAVGQLLNLVCEVYLPYLQANSLAFNAGEDTFSTTLRGHAYNQTTFKYQAKCLQVLRSEFAKLTETDQQNLASLVGREALRVLETSA